MKIKISTSRYNEVNPVEIDKLFKLGAMLRKSEYAIGVFIGKYTDVNGKEVKAYSNDWIVIKNVILPLSFGATYDCEVEINV